MNIYDIINIIMTYALAIFCACMIMVLMYACAMRALYSVRMHDAVTYTRTHGAVVRTPEYMARCEDVVYHMYMHDDMDMTA